MAMDSFLARLTVIELTNPLDLDNLIALPMEDVHYTESDLCDKMAELYCTEAQGPANDLETQSIICRLGEDPLFSSSSPNLTSSSRQVAFQQTVQKRLDLRSRAEPEGLAHSLDKGKEKDSGSDSEVLALDSGEESEEDNSFDFLFEL